RGARDAAPDRPGEPGPVARRLRDAGLRGLPRARRGGVGRVLRAGEPGGGAPGGGPAGPARAFPGPRGPRRAPAPAVGARGRAPGTPAPRRGPLTRRGPLGRVGGRSAQGRRLTRGSTSPPPVRAGRVPRRVVRRRRGGRVAWSRSRQNAHTCAVVGEPQREQVPTASRSRAAR